MSFATATGTVESYDADVGLGHVVDESGNRWMFHCTAIADGSRTIEPGSPVRFEVSSGGPGRWEAFVVSQQN